MTLNGPGVARIALAASLTSVGFLCSANAAPVVMPELTLLPDAGGIVQVLINNRPARLRVEFDADSIPVLNPDAAKRLGLKSGLFVGARTSVGPIKLKGKVASASFASAGTSIKRRFVWFDRDVTSGADGVIGPSQLPYSAVTMQLRETRPDDRDFPVPVALNPPGLEVSGLYAPQLLEGATLFARFSLTRPTTLATASGGAILQRTIGGDYAGPVLQRVVHYGVQRPVRVLRLARPARMGGFSLTRTEVRGSAAADAAEMGGDQDEIVVTAQKDSRPGVVTLGRDVLGACASVRYVRPGKLLFTCPAKDEAARVRVDRSIPEGGASTPVG